MQKSAYDVATDDEAEPLYREREEVPDIGLVKTCVSCRYTLNTYNHAIGLCFVCQEKGRIDTVIDTLSDSGDDEETIGTGYPENVMLAVCEEYGISLAVLCDSWGTRVAIGARHAAIWILYHYGKWSRQEISKMIHAGNRTGTGVNYALKRIEQQMQKDPALVERINKISVRCGSLSNKEQ